MGSYSIAIRTLGTAGIKYQKLLKSIANLSFRPDSIIVVLPEGYDLPKDQLGYEKFVFSPKGMMPQRLEALKYITSDYTLFCDDDVEFPPDFAEKLMQPLEQQNYSCSAGPLLDFFPPQSIKYVLASVLGGACVMLHGCSSNYVRILRTSGWSYSWRAATQELAVLETQSLAGPCFMVRTKDFSSIDLQQEFWADKNGYAAIDDQIMAYKLHLNGYRCCIVCDAKFVHNDAKTSTKNMRLEPMYAGTFNHYVFWHRFIYSPDMNTISRLWSHICIGYYQLINRLYSWILLKCGRYTLEGYQTIVEAQRDAKNYVHSSEYVLLPSAVVRKK